MSRRDEGSETPTRVAMYESRTPQRTPQRNTPTRTPTGRSFFNPGTMQRPTPPDFTALAKEQQQQQQQQQRPAVLGKRNDNNFVAYNPEKEPIKAYLRIRPPPSMYHEEDRPYLKVVDDIEVSMTPPSDSNAYRTRNRAPERYKFSKIFTENVKQKDFFDKTTLPLVEDVLKGENALVFAYGVTNSGKTYTVMGTKEEIGLVPRTLDVIFNSVQGYLSESKLKPTMHSLVQTYHDPAEENRDMLDQIMQGTTEGFAPKGMQSNLWNGSQPTMHDQTVIDINQKYEYGIWLSFAEIYTEKIYDLLVPPDRHLKRRQLPLKYEFRSGHKYIAGLKQVKVQSIEEAYALMEQSQKNRAVYSTLLNHTSSRSHSIFTINIVRAPIDDEDYVIEDPSYASVSRMSIVDLAGSERHRNTFNSGQRLKEAGNINKSLMVLGQCMETLRLNQLKADMGKRQAIVPFRHSKLTELFKSSFEGDGKAVMVVNVNPFDTGFDENSHVMKFAAVAKNVATWRRIHPKLDLHNISGAVKRLRTQSGEMQKQYTRYTGNDSMLLDDIAPESSTDDDDDDDDDEEQDPFVDNLIGQLEELRSKWIEAESRCATIESTVRQQVSVEMENELRKMEDIYMTALQNKNDLNQSQLQEQLERMKDDDGNDPMRESVLADLRQRQENLTVEIDRLRAVMRDHEATKNSLLDKITELENDKRREQEHNKQLLQQLRNDKEEEEKPKSVPMEGVEEDVSTQSSDAGQQPSNPDPRFQKLLDLRKRLRRSVFKGGNEYADDTSAIMKQVEEFEDVTFELVKETNMGRLLKLIAQQQFEKDPDNIQERSKKLFKRFAQLSINVLAPPPPPTPKQQQQRRNAHHTKHRHTSNTRNTYRTVLVSVDAGKEEDLISDMRVALETLQHENSKLKNRVKTMQEGHRRLKEAFKKTKDLENDVPSLISTSHILEKESLDFGAATTTQRGKGVANKSTALDEENSAACHDSSGELSPVLEAPSLPMPDSSDDEYSGDSSSNQEPLARRRRKTGSMLE
ncbi:hypothetical protein O0I10_002559 [Lichtheimia ornata]|uniref:Kinesin motor domain-containing protein n=1 Tax=Lichtheimia ornata TaxID=688661 RepID=A0AAD7V9Z1_9FUNG|nr:uncharacterized protein O0I10_002559 [Lichtheimia ornata]KAJ8661752.1 hypothetical protein O0I10_002559 [Lichtheimia ornata]